MARIITKELALKIRDKLRGQNVKSKSGAHDFVEVWHEGKLIAHFGIRRGSEKDKGHDHIPDEIHVGPGFAKLLGQCPKSYDDWVEEMRKKGVIELQSDDSGKSADT